MRKYSPGMSIWAWVLPKLLVDNDLTLLWYEVIFLHASIVDLLFIYTWSILDWAAANSIYCTYDQWPCHYCTFCDSSKFEHYLRLEKCGTVMPKTSVRSSWAYSWLFTEHHCHTVANVFRVTSCEHFHERHVVCLSKKSWSTEWLSIHLPGL